MVVAEAVFCLTAFLLIGTIVDFLRAEASEHQGLADYSYLSETKLAYCSNGCTLLCIAWLTLDLPCSHHSALRVLSAGLICGLPAGYLRCGQSREC